MINLIDSKNKPISEEIKQDSILIPRWRKTPIEYIKKEEKRVIGKDIYIKKNNAWINARTGDVKWNL
jgi:hypothetical protein